MVFKSPELRTLPPAVSLPKMAFRRPSGPVATLPDPGSNRFHPDVSQFVMSAGADADDGDASPCSAEGVAETSWDSVVGCSAVAAAWATAADWTANLLGLVVRFGCRNGLSWLAAAEAPA
jgi:hypothetical protein